MMKLATPQSHLLRLIIQSYHLIKKRSIRKQSLFAFSFVLLLFGFSQSFGQTTITTGNTVNASAIPVNNTVTINAGGTLNMDVSRNDFPSILVNLTGNSNITGSGILTTGSLTFTPGGGNTHRLIIASAAIVQVSSIVRTNGTAQLEVSGTLRNTGVSNTLSALICNAGSTVEYNGGANQTVFVTTYHHLILSGSGAKLMTSIASVNGNLTLSGTASATTATALVIGSPTGNLSIGNGTTFTVAGFDLTVTGTTTVGGGTSGNLTVSSATGARTFTGLVTVANGATWNNTTVFFVYL